MVWHRSKWTPHGKIQLVTNVVTILIARSLMYTLYIDHIHIQ
jgi:hypothetical protein